MLRTGRFGGMPPPGSRLFRGSWDRECALPISSGRQLPRQLVWTSQFRHQVRDNRYPHRPHPGRCFLYCGPLGLHPRAGERGRMEEEEEEEEEVGREVGGRGRKKRRKVRRRSKRRRREERSWDRRERRIERERKRCRRRQPPLSMPPPLRPLLPPP